MTANGWFQIAFFLLLILAVTKPMGVFMARVFNFDHRAASVPYFSGKGGVTPTGGNTGPLGSLVSGFTPDLHRDENRLDLAILVKF
jgi:hypothetical protein